MRKFPAGTVSWAGPDPTGAHDDRPVVVLSHEQRPFNSVECTVMCAGTGAENHDQYAPEFEDEHLSDNTFDRRTYLMPWALYTIPPGAIRTGGVSGELTEAGERLVKKSLISLFTS